METIPKPKFLRVVKKSLKITKITSNGKNPKILIPEIAKKSFKIKELTQNYIKWEKSENQNYLKSSTSH